MNMRKWLLSIIIPSYLLISPNIYATIKVGIPFYKPPFVLNQNEGFDIDLMRTICSRLQKKCDFQPRLFHTLYAGLEKGEIDLAIGGLTISEARKTQFIFSLPYMPSNGKFLILLSSPIKTINDLKEKKIGVIRDSTYEDSLINEYGTKFKTIPFEGPTLMISALTKGDIDAVFSDSLSVHFWSQQNSELFTDLGKPIAIGSGFAIMTTSQNTALIESINKILIQMENDGTYTKIYNNYF